MFVQHPRLSICAILKVDFLNGVDVCTIFKIK